MSQENELIESDSENESPEGANFDAFGIESPEADEFEDESSAAQVQEGEEQETEDESAGDPGHDAEDESQEGDDVLDENAPGDAEDEIPGPNVEGEDYDPDGGDVRAYYKSVSKRAKDHVAKIIGAEFDEFDPEHQIILQDISRNIIDQDRELRSRTAAKDNAISAVAQAVADAAGDEQSIRALVTAVQDLPYRRYKKLSDAIENGDAKPMIEAIKEVSGRMNARKKAGSGKRKTDKTKPPVMMGSGSPNPTSGEDDEFMDGFDF